MMAIRILLVISSHIYRYFTFKKCFHNKDPQICIVGYVFTTQSVKLRSKALLYVRTSEQMVLEGDGGKKKSFKKLK